MTQEHQKQLADQILRLCEAQYRKGLQHGHHFATKKELTEEDVLDFRYNGQIELFKKSTDPITKAENNLLEKLELEMNMPEMDELESLLGILDNG